MVDSGDSVTGLPGLGGRGPVVLDGMRVLRLCSVFEPAALSGRSAAYDAIGGMHNHTAELSRHLDRMGARQLILTSRLDGPAGRTGFRPSRSAVPVAPGDAALARPGLIGRTLVSTGAGQAGPRRGRRHREEGRECPAQAGQRQLRPAAPLPVTRRGPARAYPGVAR